MQHTTTESTPANGLDFSRVVPIFVLVFVDVLGLTVILPLLHLYAAAYGATPLEIGLVAAAFPLAQLIGVPVMGALSDRYGRKPLLLISQVTTCISFVILAASNSLTMVIASRVIDGLFGANLATAQAALSDITAGRNRAQGLGLTGAAFGLGFIFGPLIAVLALELTDSLAVPALSAAVYSFISILLTIFVFKETLPEEKRGAQQQSALKPGKLFRLMANPQISVLLILMFAQQLIFFGFESLMGLFTLSRLGLLGQANALFFFLIGLILVMVQVRFIGKWVRQYGERRMIHIALSLLALGLFMTATTPEQPQPFYVRAIVEYDLAQQAPSGTEAILGEIGVMLPEDGNNGLGGVLWFGIALIPLSIGAGLIRPLLNALMTRRVDSKEYGAVLGISAAFVSAANATAPLLGGFMFQRFDPSMPFLVGSLLMTSLAVLSIFVIRPGQEEHTT